VSVCGKGLECADGSQEGGVVVKLTNSSGLKIKLSTTTASKEGGEAEK